MTIFYYTATGNSLSVAKRIGGTFISIPQAIDSDKLHYKDDVIGVVFPIFWWNLPVMVRRFFDKVTFEADYIFAIGTCGTIAGGAMVSLQKQAKRKGYYFDYTNRLLMVDNYLPVFDMGKQIDMLPKKRVEERLAVIIEDINSRKHKKTKANVGKRSMTALFKHIFKPNKNARKFIVDDKCNKCGVCTQVCPAKNIEVNEKVRFLDHCEFCLACQHLCPQNALHLKSEKSGKRWHHPDVTLKEIIEANNSIK